MHTVLLGCGRAKLALSDVLFRFLLYCGLAPRTVLVDKDKFERFFSTTHRLTVVIWQL